MLTKTTYLAYTQCPSHFWLAEHHPHLAAPPDPATQRRLRMGQEVDKEARQQFPDGRLIPYRPHPEAMVLLTTQAIAEGAQTLFQATFAVEDLLVKVDILTQTADGWHLIEVKAGTSYKEAEHLPDIAFQMYVLEQAGLTVTRASIMHLNSECRHPDFSNLFTFTDVTLAARAYLPQVAADVVAMRRLITASHRPQVSIGRHCARPHECPFYSHCWRNIDGPTIYDIPYLKREKEQQLEADGIRYVRDIPPGTSLGDKRAAAFVERVIRQQALIERDPIRAELTTLTYPLYFFDFETIDYAIPAFPGCKPYQHVPFQYSCHILHADGTLTHDDYLHTTPDDPREALVEALLTHIGDSGHLVAYNIPFERGVLHHLAQQFPAHLDRLTHMADRLWDQLSIFRKYYRHPAFGRSNSLKAVLPVIVPELSHRSLAVKNGSEAQVMWEAFIHTTDTAVKTQLANQLRAYCHLDTLAMVKIHQALCRL